MKKKIFILALVIIIIVFVIGAIKYKKDETPPETIKPTKNNIETTISVNATLKPQIYANISSETPLKISKVNVKVGDEVKKNQILARLDKRSINAQINNAKLAVERAILAEQDARSIKSKKFNTKNQRLSLKKASEQARQKLNELYAFSSKTNLTSPIDGVVTVVNSHVGEIVSGIMIRVIDVDSMKLEAYISEDSIIPLKIGQKATIEFDAIDDKVFNVTIERIDPEATNIQGIVYFKTLFSVEDIDKSIRSGMTGDIKIITDQKNNALTLPIRFVRNDNSGSYVYTKKSQNVDVYDKTYIKTGIESDSGLVEILSGITSDTNVFAIYDKE